MKSRALALVGVLALGLLPALGGAQDPVAPPAPGSLFAATDPVVNVKAEASVYGVFKDEAGATKAKFKVDGGVEWPGENVDARKDATGIAGKYVYTHVTPRTEFFLNDRPATIEALKPGTRVKVLLRTNGSPVTEACTFELKQVFAYVEGGAVEPKPPMPPKPEAEGKGPVHGFELGFFPRLWTVRGDVLGLEQDGDKVVVNVDVRRLVNQAKRFNDEGRRLVRLDAYVVVGPKTVVTDEEGERIPAKELQVDDKVKVVGKFLKPEKWVVDETEEKVPTLVAKRVKVIDRD